MNDVEWCRRKQVCIVGLREVLFNECHMASAGRIFLDGRVTNSYLNACNNLHTKKAFGGA